MRLNTISGRFAALTIIFVVLAELFILLPALSRFRLDFLESRLERAQIASLALLATDESLTSDLESELLQNAGVLNVVLRRDNVRQLVLSSPIRDQVSATYDLREEGVVQTIDDALVTLLDTYFARWLITLLAVIAGLFFTTRFGTFIARLLPKQESSATTADELVGTVGHITVGVARQNSPAEGKFIDAHGQPHYLLVEPLEPDEQFSQGEKILLIQKRDYRWLASRYSDL